MVRFLTQARARALYACLLAAAYTHSDNHQPSHHPAVEHRPASDQRR